jgi:hypothetical protein
MSAVERLRAKLARPQEPIRLATVARKRPVAPHPRATEDGLQWVDAHTRTYEVNVGAPLPHLPGGQYYRFLEERDQEFVRTEMDKLGLPPDEVYRHFKETIGGPNTQAMRDGVAWYLRANRLAWAMNDATQGGPHPLSLEQAAAAIAVMSPNAKWDVNIETAARMVQWVGAGGATGLTPDQALVNFRRDWVANAWGGWTKGSKREPSRPRSTTILGDNMLKAMELLLDPDLIDEHLSTVKVHSFYNNVVAPGETDDVTVDIHVGKVTGWIAGFTKEQWDSLYKRGRKRNKEVVIASLGAVMLAPQLRRLAAEWKVKPLDVQAAYWVVVREQQPPGWDPPTGKWDTDTVRVRELLGSDF